MHKRYLALALVSAAFVALAAPHARRKRHRLSMHSTRRSRK
jgi:hypothetical protein